MKDRVLLELAAKAAGIEMWHEDVFTNGLTQKVSDNGVLRWNPLTDDGDAFRLAVSLKIWPMLRHFGCDATNGEDAMTYERYKSDALAATRRAIVRAAAAIGGAKP
jgi:hypothetical protein